MVTGVVSTTIRFFAPNSKTSSVVVGGKISDKYPALGKVAKPMMAMAVITGRMSGPYDGSAHHKRGGR